MRHEDERGRESLVKRLASEAGFDLSGIASLAAPPSRLEFLAEWLAEGYAGEMAYLERQKAKRLDPCLVLPGAKSLVCVGLLYNTPHPYSSEVPGQPWISRYAWGDDYHDIVAKKLDSLNQALGREFPAIQTRAYVDTGPVSEKAWASAAGLGWIGKNTCLIHPKLGSWLFLAEIITDLDLQPDAPQADLCGSCRRCLEACPTQAFPEAYVLDARLCISYLTIEKRGDIPPEQKKALGRHLYGCDICQDVCPWNHWKRTTAEPAFQPRLGNLDPDPASIAAIPDVEFAARFAGSPIKRAKPAGLRRNAAAVLDNRKPES